MNVRHKRTAALLAAVAVTGVTGAGIIAGTASAAGTGTCTENVNVRSEPSKTAPVVGTCEKGASTRVGETRNGFVKLDEFGGWAAKEYVKTGSAGTSAPNQAERGTGSSGTGSSGTGSAGSESSGTGSSGTGSSGTGSSGTGSSGTGSSGTGSSGTGSSGTGSSGTGSSGTGSSGAGSSGTGSSGSGSSSSDADEADSTSGGNGAAGGAGSLLNR